MGSSAVRCAFFQTSAGFACRAFLVGRECAGLENKNGVKMGKEERAVKPRYCQWCEQEHNMTADDIMDHHEFKLQEKLDQDQKERKSGKTGSD